MTDAPKPARKQIRYDIPPGTAIAECRGCGAAIAWIRTPAGKAMPVDGDGTPHFATCPKAAQFKKAKTSTELGSGGTGHGP